MTDKEIKFELLKMVIQVPCNNPQHAIEEAKILFNWICEEEVPHSFKQNHNPIIPEIRY